MRKQILLLSLMFITAYCNRIFAGAVAASDAQTVAVNFYKGHFPSATVNSASLYYTRIEADGTVDYYIFNTSPAVGFVIVAADNSMTPVIAYSSESYFRTDVKNKTGVSNWMNGAGRYIHQAILSGYQASATVAALWSAYLQGPYASSSSRSGQVGPLLGSITWDQENDYNYPPPYEYNFFCPYNSTYGQRCVTGCVATAMGQIMRYWKYPATGAGSYSYSCVNTTDNHNYGTLSANFGNTTYNWTAMPVALTNTTTSSQDSAVSLLIYQAGVSVAMNYGTDSVEDGSGSYMTLYDAGGIAGSACAQNSYPTYFKYNASTIQGYQYSYINRVGNTVYNYTSTQWIDSIEKEVNAGRPLQYAGDDATAGGHSWVCDGYDASSNVHMNWGWGGYDDGFFAISALNPAGQGVDFIENEEILTGIEPPVTFSLTAAAAANPLCSGDTTRLTLTGAPATGVTYAWSPAAGLTCTTCASPYAHPTSTTTYTVTVDSSGVSVTASLTLSVSSKPATPASASLPTACAGQSAAYTVAAVSGATSYIWTVSGTGWSGGSTTSTNSTNLTAGSVAGSVTVKASNSCGISSGYTFNVPITSVPDAATAITVPGQICSGQTVNLSTPAVTGATSYDWTITGTGWSGSSTTDAISLTAGTGTANIAVNGVNACGSGTPYASSATALTSPVAAYTLSAPSVAVSVNDSLTFAGTAAAGTTYTWDFGGGSASPGTGAGPQTVQWTTAGTKYVTLTLDNGGCTSAYTDSVVVVKSSGINTVATAIDALSIAPNPTSGQASILISMTAETSVSIVIYDMEGRLVETIYTGALGAGESTILFNTENITSGIYMVKVSSAASSIQKRFVKI